MSRFLFDHLDELTGPIKAGRSLALFLDFDGTLVAFEDRPDQVQLPPAVRDSLLALSRKANLLVGIVSGRQRADLQTRVGVPDLIYAGNHGLEISGPGFIFIEPTAVGYREKLQAFAKSLPSPLKPLEGA